MAQAIDTNGAAVPDGYPSLVASSAAIATVAHFATPISLNGHGVV